ncbi:MAG: tRNA(Ile)-lysidine synthase [Holosporales bacterium]
MNTFLMTDALIQKTHQILNDAVLSNSYSSSKKIAVAVSGGPDSLALCLIINEWAKENGGNIVALTVDHNLREESKDEAQQVEMWLKKYQIPHVILKWDHPPLQSRVQEHARNARYHLLEEYCTHHNIQILCTGHHLQDQFETFMMRLSKGSGSKGLACMQPISKRNNLFIVRPLLSILPDDLKAYLYAIKQDYISDPSNDNDVFERVRWRKALLPLLENGFSLDHFNKSIQKLNDLNFWIDECLEDAAIDCIEETDGATIIDIPSLIQLNKALSIKMISQQLQKVSNAPYPSSYDKAKDIVVALYNQSFINQSAGGCVLSRKKNKLYITKDPRAN